MLLFGSSVFVLQSKNKKSSSAEIYLIYVLFDIK